MGEPIDLEIDGNMTSINVESEKVSPLPDGQPAPIPVHNSPIYQEAFLEYPDYLVVKTARASPDASTFTATFKDGHFETGLTREQIGALPHRDLQAKCAVRRRGSWCVGGSGGLMRFMVVPKG